MDESMNLLFVCFIWTGDSLFSPPVNVCDNGVVLLVSWEANLGFFADPALPLHTASKPRI